MSSAGNRMQMPSITDLLQRLVLPLLNRHLPTYSALGLIMMHATVNLRPEVT